MDEYQLIVLAKLKADRLALRREARAERAGQAQIGEPAWRSRQHSSRRARRFNQGPQGSIT